MQNLNNAANMFACAAEPMRGSLQSGAKITFCGNGGSAADARHLATELMGRHLRDRAPLPASTLAVDTSASTAIANEDSFE
jgi:D-sedoheptulose 7-phosphate isomerase